MPSLVAPAAGADGAFERLYRLHAGDVYRYALAVLGNPSDAEDVAQMTFATLARTNEIAAQMAVEEINAAGGVNGKKVRLISFDTAGKPEQAVVGVRKLAEDDKVLAIIGPFSSGECRVAFPVGERTGVVMMSMASSAPKLAEPFTYGLRNTSDEGYMFRHVMKTLQD